MATARSAAARPRHRPQHRRSQRARALPRATRGIRWDRLSRAALLTVLLGLFFLYVGPVHSYWSTVNEAKHRRAEVGALKHENARLRVRRDDLRSAGSLEREARKLGLVRSRERAYVVEHLPAGP